MNAGIDVSIGNEYVEQTVVIVLEKARAPAQKRYRQCRDSSAEADVGKGRVTVITVERVVIVGEIRDVEIDFAVTVVIADGDSHGGLLAPLVVQSKSRKIADIFKRAVVFVPVKILCDRIARHGQIHPSVVIPIHEPG